MKNYLIAVLSLAQIAVCGQRCYTSEKLAERLGEAGMQQFLAQQAALHNRARDWSAAAMHRSVPGATYTVPVVFHILHQGGGENISDAQVQDAVSILNRDYQAMNADTANAVAQFKSIIGNPRFAFRLATRDPQGNCTNGIIRHWDANTAWSGDDANCIYTWPSTSYLNVYVVKSLWPGTAGYSSVPGWSSPNADIIVILHNYIGSIGTGNVGSSRALTHEVGHWFGLAHTWGWTNSPGVACGDDGIADTPLTMGYTSCNLSNAAICTPGVVENVQNYMEYAYCQVMFTQDQATYMQYTISNDRSNISSVANLANTGVSQPAAGCIPAIDIHPLPTATVCAGQPLEMHSYTHTADPDSYQWSAGPGVLVTSGTSSVAQMTFFSPGVTSVICVASNANGASSATTVVYVKGGAADVTGTTPESFELAALPAKWSVPDVTSWLPHWRVNKIAASHGVQSVYVPGDSMAADAVTILETPAYDFKNNPGASFSFRYAYARRFSGNKDIFKVQASKDCGGTWTDVWLPGLAALAASSGGLKPNPFVPTPGEWATKVLTENSQFAPFLTEDHVTLRFYFQEDHNGSGYGNRLYLDEINFDAPTAVGETARGLSFAMQPNPAQDEVRVSFSLSRPSPVRCIVTDLAGKKVKEAAASFDAGSRVITIDIADLETGMYLVTLNANDTVITQKLIRQ